MSRPMTAQHAPGPLTLGRTLQMHGGVLACLGGSITIASSKVSHSNALGNGGVLYASTGSVIQMTGSSIAGTLSNTNLILV